MEEKIEDTKLLTERARHILDEIFATGKYEEFIKGMVHHSNYSINNQALIMEYAPYATEMKSMRAWNYLGRYVKDNETGTPTLSPVFNQQDKETNKSRGELTGFQVSYRFDTSQTGGSPYRSLRCQEGEAARYSDLIIQYLENTLISQCKGEDQDQYSLRNIYENTNFKELDSEDKVRVIVEETNLQLLLNKIMNQKYSGLIEAEKMGINEVMLSAINYITLTRLGLEADAIVVPNLYNFTSLEYGRFKNSLETMRQTAQIVINSAESAINMGRKAELLQEARESMKKSREDKDIRSDKPKKDFTPER